MICSILLEENNLNNKGSKDDYTSDDAVMYYWI